MLPACEELVFRLDLDGKIVFARELASEVRCEPQVFLNHVICVIRFDLLGQHERAQRFAQSPTLKPYAPRDAREPWYQRRFDQPLKIEREIEPRSSQPPRRPTDRRKCLKSHRSLSPAAQIEFDQFIETRIAFQQFCRASALDCPGEVSIGHRAPQCPQRGQRVYDVAYSSESDDQNSHQ